MDASVERLFVGGPAHGKAIAISRHHRVLIPVLPKDCFATRPTFRHCAEMDEVRALTGRYQYNLLPFPEVPRAAVYERVWFRIRGRVMVFFCFDAILPRRDPDAFWSLAVDAHFIWRRRQRVAEGRAKSARR